MIKNNVPFLEIVSLDESRKEGKYTMVKCRSRFPELGPGFYRLLPDDKKVTVKSLEKQGEFYYLALKGVVKKAISWRKILVPVSQVVTMSKKAFIMLPQGNKIPKGIHKFSIQGGFTETYPLGFWQEVSAFIKPIGGDHKKLPSYKQMFQIKFTRPVPMISGGLYTLTAEGGDKSFQMVVIYPRSLPDTVFKDFIWRVQRFRSFPSIKSIFSIQIRALGLAQVPEDFTTESFDGISFLGNWGVMEEQLGKIERTILKRSKQPGGILREELAGIVSVPGDFLDLLVSKLEDEEKIRARDKWILNTTVSPESGLSPFAKSLWQKLSDAGIQGVYVKDKESEAVRENFKAFCRMDIAIPLEDLYIEKKAFLSIVEKVLAPYKKGDTISIADVRDITGFSRPYVLALFHHMEEGGHVEREGDLRRIL